MKNKKYLMFVLMTALLLAMFAFAVSAVDYPTSGQCGNSVFWTYNEKEGTITISGKGPMYESYGSNNTALDEELKPFTITQAPWYHFWKKLYSVKIEEGVTSVSVGAFRGCRHLFSVSLAESLTSIGSYAFYDCNLYSVYIPESVTRIQSYCFADCKELSGVSLSSCTTSIGAGSFAYNSIRRLVIPKTLESIGGYAFNGCTVLESIIYTGSQEDWESINIGDANSRLDIVHFTYNHEHNMKEVSNTASCTENGIQSFSCSYCSYNRKSISAPTGHKPGRKVVEAATSSSCSNSYDNVVYCTKCNEELSRETITNHSAGNPIIENEIKATCDHAGYYDEVIRCTACNEIISSIHINTEKLQHISGEPIKENVIEATCTQNGSYDDVVYCELCGRVLSRTHGVIIGGHKRERRDTILVQPTCDEEGSKEILFVCSVCGEVLYRTVERIAPLLHQYGDYVQENMIEATCYEDGSYDRVRYCSLCGEEMLRETIVIKTSGHHFALYRENEIPATYDEMGSYEEVSRCSVCSLETNRVTKIIPKKVCYYHEYEAVAKKDATCDKTGETLYVCKNCGFSYPVYDLALGHADTNNDGKCDTCGEKMTGGKHCKYCGKIHGGAFGWLTKIFHSILAIFKR